MDHKAKKISVKIWLPALKKFDEKLENACIRRDAYLNKVLEKELKHLDKEVALPNSQIATDFIRDRLNQLDRKLVSLALREDLVARLDDICKTKLIDRDAFFNRLFLFLASENTLKILFQQVTQEWLQDYLSDKSSADRLLDHLYPLPEAHDPFWAIRCSLEFYNQDPDNAADKIQYTDQGSGKVIQMQKDWSGNLKLTENIYTKIIEENLSNKNDLRGLNCYLPDWHVPETNEYLQYRQTLDDLIML